MLADTQAFLNELKSTLSKPANPDAPVNTDIYSHLNEVINRILKYHQKEGVDHFEEISSRVKKTNFKIHQPKSGGQQESGQAEITYRQAKELIEKAKSLLDEKPANVKTADRALIEPSKAFTLPNLSKEAEMLSWAGISFGEDITYLLQKSLKRLAAMSGASSLRFWGQIYGMEKDYWIAQGTLDF